MTENKKSALLYSGGLDAYCIDKLFEPDKRVFVDVGTDECTREIELINRNGIEVETVEMQFLANFEKQNKIIPFRNAFLVMAGAMYAENVWLGATYGDGEDTVDTDPAFRSLAEAMLNKFHEPDQSPGRVEPPYQVKYPAQDLTKGDLVKKVTTEEEIPVWRIAGETKSCHHGGIDKGCGSCMGCVRRFVALCYGAQYDPKTDPHEILDHFQADPRWRLDDPQTVNSFNRRGKEDGQYREVSEHFEIEPKTTI